VLVELLGYEIDRDIAENILAGMLSDTGNFTYPNKYLDYSLQLFKKLVDTGLIVDQVISKFKRMNEKSLLLCGELIKNSTFIGDIMMSHIDEEIFYSIADFETDPDFAYDSRIFADNFLRLVGESVWGFTIEPRKERGVYKISFRSINGTYEVDRIARRLGGGGHKGAAGATVKAKSIDEVYRIVKEAIRSEGWSDLIDK
ncbi:MAG TPA: hypothetical protein ENN64_00895, partial [bacterium]|nr:hypothetical protein [bacterium]